MEDSQGFEKLNSEIGKLTSMMDELINNIDSLYFRLGEVKANLKKSQGDSIEARNKIVRLGPQRKTARVTQREYDELIQVPPDHRAAKLERIRRS